MMKPDITRRDRDSIEPKRHTVRSMQQQSMPTSSITNNNAMIIAAAEADKQYDPVVPEDATSEQLDQPQ